MRHFLRPIIRFVVVGVLDTLSLVAMDWLVPGIVLSRSESIGELPAAVSVALMLSIMNTVVRPVLVLLTLPLNLVTLGFATWVVNAGMLWLTSEVLPYFIVESWEAALWGAVILAAVNTFLTSLTTISDDYSFFEGMVQWLSRRQAMDGAPEEGRGLVFLEIDGLSYGRMLRAVETGLMPTVRKMLHQGTHALSRYDCGLPSQTSAGQAGIMYGDNDDIPAFRWYDKDRSKLFVSNRVDDAAEINARYARREGLLRGGSSINNLLTGGARKTLFTLSVLTDKPQDMERRSLEDFYLFWLNPYSYVQTIVLMLWEILVELAQGLRQRVFNVWPRVNRLRKGYPLRRAISNVLLRDVGTFMVIVDVIRGVPAIYASYAGYDEIAHHAGPDATDAMASLRAFDAQIARVLDIIERKAPRPYDLFVLSDHGQSRGATFEQRYGHTLTDFIEALVEGGILVAEVATDGEGRSRVAALLAEVESMGLSVPVGRIRRAMLNQARRAVQHRVEERAALPADEGEAAQDQPEVTVCASGNLAHVYFARPGRVGLDELVESYPGLPEALVAHPGVGFIVVHVPVDGGSEVDLTIPWVVAKEGARDLQTGRVIGRDPLIPYGDPGHRAAQLLRLARFPHSGDVIVNSTLYKDGQVAAFEELVGSHGGLGGQQTDAFILHPADMVIPATSNATDLFPLLDARRRLREKTSESGEPVPEPTPDTHQMHMQPTSRSPGGFA